LGSTRTNTAGISTDMINKFVPSLEAAMAGITDGATILLGGFADVGIPRALLAGLIDQGARELTVVAVAGGRDGSANARLLELGRVRRLICSFVRPASIAARLFQRGELEIEIIPQGTMAERMRAAGAGIEAFYTPTGADTLLAEGRETREINGKLCLLEYPLHGDVALIEAWRADRWGNLIYRETQQNFNPVMAMAARLTIAQTYHTAELGELEPGAIQTPGVFVNRVLHVPAGTMPEGDIRAGNIPDGHMPSATTPAGNGTSGNTPEATAHG
jgi:3-oxoadipate CoA-transferase alpha subunit